MSKHIAIVGAGLMGRILALECQRAGVSVVLFDRDNKEGQQSCAYTGAGMLAPYTELELTEPIITALGIESLILWPQLLEKLPGKVFFQNKGTLVLAHPQDQPELARFKRSIEFRLKNQEWQQYRHYLKTKDINSCNEIGSSGSLSSSNNISSGSSISSGSNIAFDGGIDNITVGCARKDLLRLEPDLPTIFSEGIYLPEEGQIDNRQLLDALKNALDEACVAWQTKKEFISLSNFDQTTFDLKNFDLIVDCRGLGSQADLKQLRGVRGELIVVEAAGVKLNRPIRLMHPRHPIYIVPRENNRFLVGATSIESDDMRPLTVQSALELLSAACIVHPGFAQGTIVETRVNCRPALPNNLPAIILPQPSQAIKIIRINGLYRHGFLISPKLAQLALDYIINGKIDQNYKQLFISPIPAELTDTVNISSAVDPAKTSAHAAQAGKAVDAASAAGAAQPSARAAPVFDIVGI